MFTGHAENYFRNLVKSNRNQIEFTIFRLIWIQTEVRLESNQSENGKYIIAKLEELQRLYDQIIQNEYKNYQ